MRPVFLRRWLRYDGELQTQSTSCCDVFVISDNAPKDVPSFYDDDRLDPYALVSPIRPVGPDVPDWQRDSTPPLGRFETEDQRDYIFEALYSQLESHTSLLLEDT